MSGEAERKQHDQEIAEDNASRQARQAQFEGEGGKSSGISGARILGPFEFDHSTPNLHMGVEFYTPVPGDFLLDAMLFTPMGWNGTTPRFDFGPATDVPDPLPGVGMYRWLQEDVWVGLDIPDADNTYSNLVVESSNNGASLSTMRMNALSSDSADGGLWQIVAGPRWKLWVTQNGLKDGAPSGSTQGTGKFYLMVATPVPF